jgi:DNA-binding response OmpR family regulator
MQPPKSIARPAKSSKKVLVVDDVEDLLDSLVRILRSDGYKVVSAADGETALRLATDEDADLVVMDHRIPKRSGAEVARMLRRSAARPKIVMHSATPEQEIRRTWDGYDDFLEKPCPPARLLATVAALLEVERRRFARQSLASALLS